MCKTMLKQSKHNIYNKYDSRMKQKKSNKFGLHPGHLVTLVTIKVTSTIIFGHARDQVNH